MTLRSSRFVRYLVRSWRDAEYAQRRLFELRSGMPFDDRPRRR